jgi:catechol 2,3-dioxygenase-like lactoylglutathione lyase family enzyme
VRRPIFLAVIIAAPAFCSALGIETIGITVSDLEHSVEFYSKVLHFEKVADFEVAGDAYEHLEGVFGIRMHVARLRLGDESLELTEYLNPKGRPFPLDTHSNDGWFQHVAIVVKDMDRAYAWLRENHVRYASSQPQRLPASNQAAGGIEAFYFRDPDGHFLEILQFPEGKGKAKWHKPAEPELFLGIDHTAIVIKDTQASLRFYRDILGMRISGESENWGPEQEHLNNVFGARLHITSLVADDGPGVEFLEYLSPGDGRSYPPEERPNDLLHWQTRFSGLGVETAAREFQRLRIKFVSAGVVSLPDSEMGFHQSVIVRDPDGHAVQITSH